MRLPSEVPTDPLEIGVDESGRGSIISSVVAGAVVMPPLSAIPDDKLPLYMAITDSKALSAKRRDQLAAFIKEYAIAWGVGVVNAAEVDRVNILQATYNAMHHAIEQVMNTIDQRAHTRILVDGNRFRPYKDIESECIVKGDAKELCIAAASIVAKTTHDQIIKDLVASDPDTYTRYGLLSNMGYGTKAHIEAIGKYGYTSEHRRSFKLKGLHSNDGLVPSESSQKTPIL